jgi:hypothetical protein
MDVALSKVFKSPVVDSILCLPQHQQVRSQYFRILIFYSFSLCSVFREKKRMHVIIVLHLCLWHLLEFHSDVKCLTDGAVCLGKYFSKLQEKNYYSRRGKTLSPNERILFSFFCMFLTYLYFLCFSSTNRTLKFVDQPKSQQSGCLNFRICVWFWVIRYANISGFIISKVHSKKKNKFRVWWSLHYRDSWS